MRYGAAFICEAHTFDNCMPAAGDSRLAAWETNALLIDVALQLLVGG